MERREIVQKVQFDLPKAHPRQYEFITLFERIPGTRFVVAACGTKFGKSYGAAIWLIQQAWNMPGSVNWWVAPTYKQSKIGYEYIKQFLPKETFEERFSDLTLILRRPDGSEHSRIVMMSGDDPGNLRGFRVHNFVLDEAAYTLEASFVSVLTTVTETFGKGIIVSTPRGRGWFYRAYQRGEKFRPDEQGNLTLPKYSDSNPDPDPEWRSIKLPTFMNPHIRPESIEQSRKTMSEDQFKQEILAEFIDGSAGVFRNIDACIRGKNFELPRSDRKYVMGVDIARINDYTVITVMDRTDKRLVYMERFNQIRWEVIYERIVKIARQYNALVVLDTTGVGDPVLEALQKFQIRIEPYKITGTTAKTQLIEKLRIALENRALSYPLNTRTAELIEELRIYEIEVTESGRATFSAPRGRHDDCVISLALCWWMLDQPDFRVEYRHLRGI